MYGLAWFLRVLRFFVFDCSVGPCLRVGLVPRLACGCLFRAPRVPSLLPLLASCFLFPCLVYPGSRCAELSLHPGCFAGDHCCYAGVVLGSVRSILRVRFDGGLEIRLRPCLQPRVTGWRLRVGVPASPERVSIVRSKFELQHLAPALSRAAPPHPSFPLPSDSSQHRSTHGMVRPSHPSTSSCRPLFASPERVNPSPDWYRRKSAARMASHWECVVFATGGR